MEVVSESQKQQYNTYKRYIVPFGIFLSAFILVSQVIMPNISNIQLNRELMEEKKEKIKNLRSTLSVVSVGLSDTVLNENLDTVTKALPETKNFFPIFMSLYSASSKANVSLEDFSIKVGNIYSKKNVTVSSKGKLFLDITIRVSSQDVNNVVKFSEELYKSMPLSEVQEVSIGRNGGVYNVYFYYKPYDLSLLQRQERINVLNPSQEKILKELKEWEKGKT